MNQFLLIKSMYYYYDVDHDTLCYFFKYWYIYIPLFIGQRCNGNENVQSRAHYLDEEVHCFIPTCSLSMNQNVTSIPSTIQAPTADLKSCISHFMMSTKGTKRSHVTKLLKIIHKLKPADVTNLHELPVTASGLLSVSTRQRKFITYRNLNDFDNKNNRYPSSQYVSDASSSDDDESNQDSQLESNSLSSNRERKRIKCSTSATDSSHQRRNGNQQHDDDASESDTYDGDADEDDEDISDEDSERRIFIRDGNKLVERANIIGAHKKLISKMVYFGIENILSGRMAGGHLHRGEYLNYVRAISLIDEHAFTDKFVERAFNFASIKTPKYGGRKEEFSIVIDLFHDGVQIFNNSKTQTVIPLMGRVISIDGHEIPSDKSRPFIIGVHHGPAKPNVHAYFYDLREELNRLHPDSPQIYKIWDEDTNEFVCIKRQFNLKVRAIIADAPARSWMCCIKGHSGFYSCSRCKIKGVHPKFKVSDDFGNVTIKSGTGVKFDRINDPLRKYEEWASYMNPPTGVKNQKLAHRNGKSPLDDIKGFDPIADVPLEVMHIVDGGIMKDALRFLLSLKSEKNKKAGKSSIPSMAKVTPTCYQSWNQRIIIWSQSTPKEMARKCETLDYFHHWKTAQVRQFFMYYMVPLMFLDGNLNFDKESEQIVLHLLRGYRLICANTHKPVTVDKMVQSKYHFDKYFLAMKKKTQGLSCTYKGHASTHLHLDVEHFKVHLGSISSYTYENEGQTFRTVSYTLFTHGHTTMTYKCIT